MKKQLLSLHDALAFQLEGTHESIKSFNDCLLLLAKEDGDPSINALLKVCETSLAEQRIKLKRIFGYLLRERYGRKSNGSDISVTLAEITIHAADPALRYILLCAHFYSVNQFNIASYSWAKTIAVRLDLDPVADLLKEMVELATELREELAELLPDQMNVVLRIPSKP